MSIATSNEKIGGNSRQSDDLPGTKSAVEKSAAEEKLCPICRSALDTPSLTPCNHEFCFACIRKWVVESRPDGKLASCPNCRAAVDRVSLGDVIDGKLIRKQIAFICIPTPQPESFVVRLYIEAAKRWMTFFKRERNNIGKKFAGENFPGNVEVTKSTVGMYLDSIAQADLSGGTNRIMTRSMTQRRGLNSSRNSNTMPRSVCDSRLADIHIMLYVLREATVPEFDEARTRTPIYSRLQHLMTGYFNSREQEE